MSEMDPLIKRWYELKGYVRNRIKDQDDPDIDYSMDILTTMDGLEQLYPICGEENYSTDGVLLHDPNDSFSPQGKEKRRSD